LNRMGGIRAYFSPCGIGYGHIARCHPIAEELMRQGATILFSTYLEAVEYARKFRFPVVEGPALSVSIDEIGQINMKMTSMQAPIVIPQFLRQVNVEIENMRAFKPDIVVSDSRISSLVAAKLLEIPSLVILNQFLPVIPRQKRFFNLSRIADGTVLALVSQGWSLSNRILIPDFPPPYTISLGNLRIPERHMTSVSFIGTILAPNSNSLEENGCLRKKLEIEDEKPFIFAPVSGPREERQPLIEKLRTIFKEFPEQYHIVMSLGDVSSRSEKIEEGNLTIIPWIENRFEYLRACDVIVSRAGHGTIMQSIYFQKPQILVPTPGHTEQYSNARRAQELGLARVMDQESIDLAGLLTNVKEMLRQREQYALNLRKIHQQQKFDGITNAISEIHKLVNKDAFA